MRRPYGSDGRRGGPVLRDDAGLGQGEATVTATHSIDG
jgi:hypothetical protein